MRTLTNLLEQEVSTAIARAFEGLQPEEQRADVAACAQEEFGHYQCNSALRLSKLLSLNPRVVAQKIIEALPAQIQSACSKIDIAGPGFINFAISPHFLSQQLDEQLRDPLLGAPRPSHVQKIVVDFSSPNVAKELHVGHIRSTIIGDSLCRLFEFLGHNVLRINHLGNWGTQFGMLIVYMKEAAPEVLAGEKPTELSSLMAWYRAAKKRFDEDPLFQRRAQQQVVALQAGDPESLQAWKLICDVSQIGFQEIYDLLHVRIESRGESFYNPFLQGVIQELEQKGLISISQGAKCIFLDGFKNREGELLPMIIQKSDGGYNYTTTDMAAMRHRIFVEKADRIIIVADNGQALHLQMIFAAAEKAGWLASHVQLNHVGFGLVLGPDGKKFKTRSGETEKLVDLLLEAVRRAREIMQAKMPEAPAQEIEHLANVIGIGAVKYADLASLRTKDYTFSYERMLRFEGNTAVFLLYAYVRISGIKRKVHVDMDEVLEKHSLNLQHPSEISLGIHLRRFGEVLCSVASDLLPNRLADYLYELSEKFNGFYRDCQIACAPEQWSRLILCELTARILKQGLEILGLETVERM